MSLIEIDSSLFYHPKMEILIKDAGCTRREAVGSLVFLWAWCSDHAPQGVLPKMNDLELAAVCKHFATDPKRFVDALVDAGFLDRIPGALAVHDWRDWIPPVMKEKIKYERRKSRGKNRGENRGNSRGKSGENPGKVNTPGESLSLPVSKPLEDLKTTAKTTTQEPVVETTTEPKKPSVKSTHVDYMDRFKVFYEARAKNEKGEPMKFKQDRHHFVIAQKLIKGFGVEALIEKTRMLAHMCEQRSTWFTKGGWGDFSIEKISKQWNAIIGETVIDKAAEFQDALRKVREQNERANKILERR